MHDVTAGALRILSKLRSGPWLENASSRWIGLGARLTLIGAIAWGVAYLESLPWFILLALAIVAWKFRPARKFDSGLHGSSQWETRAGLLKDRMIGHRDGLILGRFEDHQFGKVEALKRADL